ncbi:helix-turn-helix transcriptional regulator [Amycolatopsis sp. NBC_01480]|uniref:helix-turn-helix transcriptional regulator n=1 Tax=Amycolatopsis sp. NBC_01480 TaxID=2903562 RepID=UPI002E2B3104|nr:helix-turn-helix transcriptional regulator [Amycolatopsis sp. NBC_01480]
MDDPAMCSTHLVELVARLSPKAVLLYKFAVEDPFWTRLEAQRRLGVGEAELDELVTTLAELLLLRPSRDSSREFDAVGPGTATAELLNAEENEIRRRQAVHRQVKRELLALQPTYFEARQARRSAEAIDVVDDVAVVRQLLADEAQRCGRELHIAHPGGGMDPDGLDRSLQLDMMMLERGVVMRSVLQHSTRLHPPTQQYVAAVTKAGALVRTTSIVPRRIIVFDREVAFLPPEDGDPAGGAVVVREPAVVSHLLESFDLLWHVGHRFPLLPESGADDGTGAAERELTGAILLQMAAGVKDEVIARRLGISVRTCRRHIADISTSLGAQSRFQAGVLAKQRGLVD